MKINPLFKLVLALIVIIQLTACEEGVPTQKDTLASGSIEISVDENFKPIIEEQRKVFDSSFPDAHIKINYKPEAACIKDFVQDSTRLILVTRDLTSQEKLSLEQRKIVPTSLPIAKDGLAIIVNNSSSDTAFSISQIKGILTGVYSKKYTVVFDNQGSSNLRYILDSLIPGQKLGTNVFAAKGNDSLIDYVAKNPNAIGFVGVSYISDYSDPEGLAFIKNVRILNIYNEKLDSYYQPYQAFIAPNKYPLTRNLYYIHRETYPGLGTGFANFLSRERGQLIFKQARLFPLRTNVIFRDAAINNQ